jgi:hypothetical protein
MAHTPTCAQELKYIKVVFFMYLNFCAQVGVPYIFYAVLCWAHHFIGEQSQPVKSLGKGTVSQIFTIKLIFITLLRKYV